MQRHCLRLRLDLVDSRMGKRRWSLWIGAFVTLGVIGIIAWYRHTLASACGNQILAEIPSPDGARRVVVFERDCGATTGFSMQASLLRMGAALPNEAGNLFVADAAHSAAPAGPGGGPALEVVWANSHALVLRTHRKARVFKARKTLDGVDVAYGTVTDENRKSLGGASD